MRNWNPPDNCIPSWIVPGGATVTSILSAFDNQTCHLPWRDQPSPSHAVATGLLTCTGSIIFQKGVLDL